MPAAIGAIAIAWIVRVLSGRLVVDRDDRERFFENQFVAGRRPKRSKLSHGASILPRTQHGLTTKKAAKTVEYNQALFMEEVQKYECIYNKFSKDYRNKYIRYGTLKIFFSFFKYVVNPKSKFMSSSLSFPSSP